VIDDLGRAVEIPAPPQRIASVTLASDEILLDLVGPERLLGVTFFAADPAISNIADRLDGIARTDLVGNPELLISLEADLVVLSTYSNPAALDQLLSAGVPLVVLGSFGTLDDIRSNIAFLGEVTGEEARADAMIAQMEAALAAVRDAVAGQEPVRVLYYELGGITYGAGSTVDEIIRLAGGVNVAADAELGTYPLINPEFILATDPDVILLGGWFSGDATPRDWFSADPVFASLRAVQSGRVYAIHDAHLTSVSQHFVDGVADVARLLYPDAFSEDPDRAKPAS
jgi:iron complex transport system substrate-binding protein